ncbi:alpha/beta hydrolase [Herbiconiux sp. CPCC 205763]|uniref:Alpha/beta hydrolase n=1 Tax=Herbiconiux aconitum TaxID=2970913 RepID=A0ABT2GNY0_9MICO|nr:alpha/beta hydrolase [Herbiconiux aconitum]MCS5717937.1 alpha/beta hydrolase [Herbiconiux aconitum]
MSKPVILVLPGGGYHTLAPHEGEPVADWLRGLGWEARVIRYPVSTRHPGPLTVVQEAIAAERAAGASAVGVLGFSAGGHLAGHAAFTPDASNDERPDFAVLCYPVVSMVQPTHAGSRAELLGDDASDELRRATSLELLVNPGSPPVFLWSTAEDESVPVEQHTYPLAEALATAGVSHEVHVFETGPHGLGLADGHPAAAWTTLCATWLAARQPA